ncbi:hypothetical protein ACIOJD_04485 [Streptomyces sp. NPDC088116]|uniref:hypothetical protein n=1 Tax=Streptomyces sp. NPDC088116 TaxID=3365825 RepID=UPI00380A4069
MSSSSSPLPWLSHAVATWRVGSDLDRSCNSIWIELPTGEWQIRSNPPPPACSTALVAVSLTSNLTMSWSTQGYGA